MKAPFPVTLFLSASAAFALPTGSYLTSRGKTGCPYNPSLTLPDERTVKLYANERFFSDQTCIYDISGGLDGADVIAVMPKDPSDTARYEAERSVQQQLGDLLFETKISVDGRPVAISKYPVHGKTLQNTARFGQLWQNTRLNDSPLGERAIAWKACVNEVKALQKSVVDRLAWFATQGVVFEKGKLSTGAIRDVSRHTELLFDDQWSPDQITVDDYAPSHISTNAKFIRADWEAFVQNNIPIDTGYYYDSAFLSYRLIRGPCGMEPTKANAMNHLLGSD